jgi:acyl transferase domain-containing protein/NADPH:quinone reductase-like Zn-dependent oxidoreductase/acyl carrier protein/2-polyprenyl-3-methyl-5-hydroxy-6-metoxy-1,4-benzoquinol methylase
MPREKKSKNTAKKVPGSQQAEIMQAKTDQYLQNAIAIVGIACRFPDGANSPDEFWELLTSGGAKQQPLSHKRFKWPNFIDCSDEHKGIDRAYLIDNVDHQDMGFFGVSPKEAEFMDPQQRILLELSWEALENAGLRPSTLSGTDAAVFIGACHHDYREAITKSLSSGEAYVGTGNIPCMLANRISHFYNFKGTSLTVDAACSSSAYAIECGVKAILNGESDCVLVGSTNLILTPTNSISYYQAGMLSRAATCNPFDSSSDGYIRGEGAGMIILKSLKNALSDNDNIHAVIRSVAVNHGGKARSLTSPSALSQSQVIQKACQQAGVESTSITYIETHGTGTPVGDPIEILGLTRAYSRLLDSGKQNTSDHCCYLGAVKADIGHLEASAGMASLFKIILALKKELIPANIHLQNINAKINLSETPFQLVKGEKNWTSNSESQISQQPRRAAISSFGFGGTNSHIIIEEAPIRTVEKQCGEGLSRYVPIMLSAKNFKQLKSLVSNFSEYLIKENVDNSQLEKLAYTQIIGRERFDFRLVIVTNSIQHLIDNLNFFTEGSHSSESCYLVSSTVLDAFKLECIANPTSFETNNNESLDGVANTDAFQIGKSWIDGKDTQWEQFFKKNEHIKIPLPTYPFDRKKYWLPESALFGSRHSYAADQCQREIEWTLLSNEGSTLKYNAYLDGYEESLKNHIIDGAKVLPAVAYLRAASVLIESKEILPVSLTNVKWLKPFTINTEARGIEFQADVVNGSMMNFSFSNDLKEFYCIGTLNLSAAAVKNLSEHETSGKQHKPGIEESFFSKDDVYPHFEKHGMQYHKNFRCIEKLWLSPGYTISRLVIADRFAIGSISEGILDASLQTSIFRFLLEKGDYEPTNVNAWVPVSLDKLTIMHPLESEMWVQVDEINSLQPSSKDRLYIPSIKIYSILGVECVRLEGIEFFKTAFQIGSNDVAKQKANIFDTSNINFNQISIHLKEIIAGLIKTPIADINVSNSFSDYGVDSIVAIELVRKINEIWQTKLNATIVYEYPNISALAKYIDLTVQSDLPKDEINNALNTQLPNNVLNSACLNSVSVRHEGFTKFLDERGHSINVDNKSSINANKIMQMLKDEIAKELKLPIKEIDSIAPFVSYGVDSIIGISLIKSLGSQLDLKLETTIIYDYPSIALLSKAIFNKLQSNSFTSQKESLSNLCEQVSISAVDNNGCYGVKFNNPGNLDQIKPVVIALPIVGQNEVLIQVHASAINFGDILCAGGLYPDAPAYPFTPGFEASGVVVDVGVSVTGFKVGDEVIALADAALGAHATYFKTEQRLVVHKPKKLSHEDACAMPVVGITALDILHKAQITSQDKILIQTAAGGLGLMLVQLAKYYGATIYATAGSDEKLNYLSSIGVKHLINYRNTDFEAEINRLTHGAGVDIVVNTLPGEALQKGLHCLAPGGRYLDVAMTSLKSAKSIDLSVMNNNQSFFSINMRKVCLDRKNLANAYLKEMVNLIENNIISPNINDIFNLEKIKDAYHSLGNRENIGKAVIKMPLESQKKDDVNQINAKSSGRSDQALEAIAIVGVSGRFSNLSNLEDLWSMLRDGSCLIEDEPRWGLFEKYQLENPDFCYKGNFLSDIDKFDAFFFNISGTEALHMDPQQRLFLEESWNALEMSGYVGSRKDGLQCGVYVGCTQGDYQDLFKSSGKAPAQAFWGNASSVVPARIAYHLDLNGPAVTIDTACSSSLVAIHQACQAIWLGEIDLAIAGGVFVQSTEKFYNYSNRASMLSKTGKCHTFSEAADGFVPGEGVGAVVLTSLSNALKNRDNIIGVIKGIGTNQDGTTNGITAPNSRAQTDLQIKVYEKFAVNPESIGMIEAHGTGTVLGDPIEFGALCNSFSKYTTKQNYCALGSIKSNIGHSATAAGIAGLIKILLSFKYNQIPPTLNFKPINKAIDLNGSPFYINDKVCSWPEMSTPKRAAISSFGFSGTNAHMVLEQASPINRAKRPLPSYLFTLSARSQNALIQVVKNLSQTIDTANIDAFDLSYTLLAGRKHFEYRFVCISSSCENLAKALKSWLSGETCNEINCAVLNEDSGIELAAMKVAGNTCIQTCADASDIQEYISSLNFIADLYLKGYKLDYEQLFAADQCSIVPLQTYPFEKDSFWVGDSLNNNLVTTKGERNPNINNQFVEWEFDGKESYLVDHQVANEKVLPGVAYLVLLLESIKSGFLDTVKGQYLQISSVKWLRPLIVGENETIRLGLHNENSNLQFSFSRVTGNQCDGSVNSGNKNNSFSYCDGYLSAINSQIENDSFRIDVQKELDAGILQPINIASIYSAFSDRGIIYGESFKLIRELYIDNESKKVISRVSLSQPVTMESEAKGALISLIDSCWQAAISFFIDTCNPEGHAQVYLPFSLDQCSFFKEKIDDELWVVINNLPGTTPDLVSHDPQVKSELFLDIDVYNSNYELCMSFKRLCLRKAKQLPNTSEAEHFCFNPVWKSYIPEAKTINNSISGLIISLGSENNELRSSWIENSPMQTWEPDFDLDTRDLQNQFACLQKAEEIFIELPDCTSTVLDEISISSLYDLNGKLLKLIKLLLSSDYSSSKVSLTLISIQSDDLFKDNSISLAHTVARGMFGSLAKEKNDWQIRCIDIERGQSIPFAEMMLLGFPVQGETYLFRNGTWFHQVLEQHQFRKKAKNVYKNDGVYLIIGGAGGLGRVLSEHLIRNYQAKIVWVGRSPVNENIISCIDCLDVKGNKPEYICADASDYQQLSGVYKQILEKYGQLNGVVDSAITLYDQSLGNMTSESLLLVLKSKVDISLQISKVFNAANLDFILSFSSANSFLKAAGQGNYVGASLFKDVVAKIQRREFSALIKVVNWGFWGSTGVVSAPIYHEKLKKIGLSSISSSKAMMFLESFLASDLEQSCFIALNKRLNSLGVPIEYLEEDVVSHTSLDHLVLEQISDHGLNENNLNDHSIKDLLFPIVWEELKKSNVMENISNYYILKEGAQSQWLTETIRLLSAERFIDIEHGKGIVKSESYNLDECWQAWHTFLKNNQQSESRCHWINLVNQSLINLGDVLQGKVLATEALFPNSSTELVENVYKKDSTAAFFNESMAALVYKHIAELLKNGRNRDIRILEIGAGTGSASEKIFNALHPIKEHIADYCYSDASIAFTSVAESRYKTIAPYISSKVINIENPETFKELEGRYDLIIASNVLHATKNISNTLANTKSLLKDNALLILNEISQINFPMHLTFGLLNGWWLYNDNEVRMQGGPGLTPQNWKYSAQEAGFTDVLLPMEGFHHLGYQIVIAQNDNNNMNEQYIISTLETAFSHDASLDAQNHEPNLSIPAIWDVSSLEKEAAIEFIIEYLLGWSSKILSIHKDKLSTKAKPFSIVVLGNFGLDSLLSTSLRKELAKDLKVDVSVQALIGEKIRDVAEEIYQQLLVQKISNQGDENETQEVETFSF